MTALFSDQKGDGKLGLVESVGSRGGDNGSGSAVRTRMFSWKVCSVVFGGNL